MTHLPVQSVVREFRFDLIRLTSSLSYIIILSFLLPPIALYQGNFTISKAPTTLKDALDKYDIERANAKFGFPKDQTHQQKAQAATALQPPSRPPLQPPVPPSAAGNVPLAATGSAVVPHANATIKQEPSSHKPTPVQGVKPDPPRRVSDQGYAPHQRKMATTAPPPQARQSRPPRRVSDQGYAPTTNREYPKQPTIAPTPKVAHVTANRTVGSTATSTAGSHQEGYPSSNHNSRPGPLASPACKSHTTLQMPPPTPSQGLFQSSLFGGGNHDEPPPLARPSTSSGRKSMDAGVAPAPLVTPVTLKRPPLVQVQDLDPSSVSGLKKPNNFNPYANHCKKML